MSQRIFISSVQREFAKERKALAEYVRKDAILGRFFDVFLFEEVPAQERKADGVYLAEVDACDIYLGIFGHTYGNVDSSGVSATEREYLRAAKRHKTRAMYLKGYIEKSGTGTGDMIAKCASWGVPAPEWYEDDPDDFRVVLKRPVTDPNVETTMVKTRVETRVETRVKTGVKSSVKSSVESSVKSRVKSSVKKLSSAEKILAYLRTTPTASAHELSIVVNLTVRAVEKNLRALRESNRLRRVGPDKGGHWEVVV